MRVGVVDIGTNSVRLLVAEPDGPLRWLDRRVTVVRLGEGVDATGRLAVTAMARALRVLGDYKAALEEWQVEVVGAVATSAARDAANRGEFLERASAELGFEVRLISGEKEAMLSFSGATSGLSDPLPPFLVVDVGGGSTELVFGSDGPTEVISVDIGSVRLTERCLPDRPAPPAQLSAAEALVAAELERVQFPDAATVIGVAGTFTSLAAIDLDLPVYDPQRVHGSRLSLDRLGELISYLAGLTLEETAAIPSLDPARAPVLLGGAVVAEATVRRSGHSEVLVSECDLLDGLALAVLSG